MHGKKDSVERRLVGSSVGTLLENTRLEKTRIFLNLRVLARKLVKEIIQTRLVLEGRVSSITRVFPSILG